MKKSTRTLITTAAIAGLLSGVAVNQSFGRDDQPRTNTAPNERPRPPWKPPKSTVFRPE